MKRCAAFLAAIVLGSFVAHDVEAATLSVQVTLSSEGKVRLGTAPASSGMTWATPPTQIQLTAGVASSRNLQGELLTCDAGFSCTTAITGCTLGTGLTYSLGILTTTTSVVAQDLQGCVLQGTRNGITSNAPGTFRILVTAASPDTTPPTIPRDLQVVNGIGQATVSFDRPADPLVSGVQGSQVAVDVYLNGSLVGTVPAVSGLSLPFTLANRGSISPTPTATQGTGASGANWTLTGAGSIYNSGVTTDGAGFLYTNVTTPGSSPVSFSVSLAGFSVPATSNYWKHGPWVVDNATVANSRGIYAVGREDGPPNYDKIIEIRERPTDGAAPVTVATSGNLSAWPRDAVLMETAPSVFGFKYVNDAGQWTTLMSGHSLPMSATKAWGLACTSSTTTAATCLVNQVALTVGTRQSYTIIGTTAGTVTLKARDAAGNTSAASAGIAIAPQNPVDSTPPSAPTGGSCTALGQTSGSCTVSGLPTDPSGIRGYIPSCGTGSTTTTDFAEQPTASYTVTGLSAGTTRYCRFKAVDGAGNVSAYSTAASFTTTTPPATLSGPPTDVTLSSVGTADPTTILRVTATLPAGTHHVRPRYRQQEVNWMWVSPQTYTTSTFDLVESQLPNQCYVLELGAFADVAETVGFWSAPATGCTAAGSGGGGGGGGGQLQDMKWHPGLYWQQRPFLSYEPGRYMTPPSACGAEPAIVVGCGPTIYWNGIETNTRGVYNWELIDRYFVPAKAAGKRFGLNVWAQVVSSGPYYGWPTYALPTYLNQSRYCGGNTYANCGAMPQDYGSTARLWDPDVMEAFADMIVAICNRYNGDSHFEYIMLPETSIGNAPSGYGDPDYSSGGLAAQYGVLFERARAACPNTLITTRANWGDLDDLEFLAKKAEALKIGIGTTDVTARRVTTMDQLLTGAIGGVDYRGRIPIMPASEFVNYLNGDCATTTMAYAKNTYKATHVMANDMQATEGASSCQQWSAVKSAVTSQGGFVTTCPSGMSCRTTP